MASLCSKIALFNVFIVLYEHNKMMLKENDGYVQK